MWAFEEHLRMTYGKVLLAVFREYGWYLGNKQRYGVIAPHGEGERSPFWMDLKSLIRVVPDFPEPGISFKDITTLLKNGPALAEAVKRMADAFREENVDLVVGVESRGFIFGAPVAYELGVGFIIVRKPGKLPADKYRVDYELEYGHDALEMHKDAIQPGQRVLIVDDLLATGGTIAATCDLVRRAGGEIVGCAFLIELAHLGGRERLKGERIHTLVTYDS